MASPLIATKLHVPGMRPKAVPRPRLLQLLERGRAARLTLISAPAGFGKTSLLAEWLDQDRQDNLAIAWLSLDESDREPAIFWPHLLAALQAALARLGKAFPELPGAATPDKAFLAILLNQLATLDVAVLLVLDDFHAVDHPETQSSLGFLLEHLPAHVRIVISTRVDPALPLPRLRARGELVEIRAADLRMNAAEGADYLQDCMGLGRPIMFDEFAHLYFYNWRELATDPGLRQWWGKFLEQQWEEIRASRNGIGGSIWAAIDDYFLVPQRDGTSKWLGHGEWGPIDGWRRPKPEYEHLSRVFDPIKVKRDGATITVENRFDFTDLSEVVCTWEAAGQSGRQRLSAEPVQSARFELPPALSAAPCTLDFKLARLAYHRRLEVFASSEATPEAAPASELLEVSKDGEAIRLGAWSIEEREQPAVVTPDGVRIPLSHAIVPTFPSWEITKRPAGKVLALDNILTDWELSARQVGKDRGGPGNLNTGMSGFSA